MTSEGDELAELLTLLAEDGERFGAREPPMTSDDMTGGPKPSESVFARAAWEFIDRHASASEPMPDWVVAYLKRVARRIADNAGTSGGLEREGAHAALGISGKAPPERSDVHVYYKIRSWIDDAGLPMVTGPKSGAARYIKEFHPDDRAMTTDSIIQKYKRGKRVWEAEN